MLFGDICWLGLALECSKGKEIGGRGNRLDNSIKLMVVKSGFMGVHCAILFLCLFENFCNKLKNKRKCV